MNLRRTTTRQPAAPAPEEAPPAKAGGKGRPTPKRSQAQGKRRAAITPAPTDRKQAARLQREAAKAARQRHRVAMATGDEKNYPLMHAGKERALVRDVIDSRRGVAWVTMPAFILLFVLLVFVAPSVTVLFPVLNAALYVLVILAFTDTVRAWRRVRKMLADRFPTGTKEKTSTLAIYGVSRNNQFPGRRKPVPRVKPGDEI